MYMPDDSHNQPVEHRVAAVVLAGGLARRMGGVDKGLVELNGKPMVEWALQRILPQVGRVIINANRNPELYGRFAVPVVADAIEGHLGPLAGLLTAMQYFDEDYVFMCPCDSPFLPPTMVKTLYDAMQSESAGIAVATDGERQQPVFLLAHKKCLPSLQKFLAAGERKIDRWFNEEKLVEVSFAGHADAFRNINTEEELMAVEKELSSQ